MDSEDVENVGIKENETVDLEVVFRLTHTDKLTETGFPT